MCHGMITLISLRGYSNTYVVNQQIYQWIHIFRFVNLTFLSGLENIKLWDIIKNYKLNYIVNEMNILNTKLPCFLNDNYILSTEEEMEFTVDSIEEELEKN